MAELLRVENLAVSKEGKEIIKGVSFSVNKGEIVCVLGPNGAGKSTLLRAIVGQERYEGKIWLSPEAKISYLPQRFFESSEVPLLVKEYFALLGFSEEKVKERLKEFKESEELLNQEFRTLSGGQTQKVFLITALLQKANLLLLDEPLAFVDIKGQESFFEILETWKKEKGISALLVTHEVNIVNYLADKVICLNKEMLCLGAPIEVLTPEKLQELYKFQPKFYVHKHQ